MDALPTTERDKSVLPDRGHEELLPLTEKIARTNRKFYRHSIALDSQEVEDWHARYKAAGLWVLQLEHPVIKEIQSDKLDDNALENCIAELSKDITIKNRFCTDCQHLFDNWPDRDDPQVEGSTKGANRSEHGIMWMHAIERKHHTLVMEAAARRGCRFCGFIIQMMRDGELLEIFRRVEARLEVVDDKAWSALSASGWNNYAQPLGLSLPGKVHAVGLATKNAFPTVCLDKRVDTFDQQRDVLDIAKSWLDNCSQNHNECKPGTQGPLPTRLISIAADTPRLVLTEGWQTKPRYSTLSHCWGTEPFLTLTRENYKSFLTVIPIDDAPKSFTDAISITRSLGLEYLWIDSWCIIQKGEEDWRSEAASMSAVYGGSFVNIAAASATNAYQGCFLKPDHLVDGLRATITMGGSNYVQEFSNPSVYDLSIRYSYLATRAWTLQEKILPSRTIHFGNRGAFWECKELTANEFLPLGSISLSSYTGEPLICRRQKQDWMVWWLNLVQLYSTANLTCSKDKLPALSGVARRIHEEGGGEYIAGLWQEQEIKAQLCWEVEDPRRKVEAYRAPSWSWASILLNDIYATVLDTKITLKSEDPFGEVSNGLLRVRCSGLLSAWRFQTGQRKSVAGRDDAENTDNNNLNTMGEEKDLEIELSDIDAHDHKKSDHESSEEEGSMVYLLPVLGGITTNVGYIEGKLINPKEVRGILLKRTELDTNKLERIESFRFAEAGGDDRSPVDFKKINLYDPFLQIFAKRGKSVAQSVAEEEIEMEETPDLRYVISIV
ncbi:HET-domain-containing protein [Byssothecium circinans]|uniref:HET-domain-containing protein n=1 Tax=Byssothecium circinans TaxID=147558 RepID=A0A6A5U3D1_9PLEO|nr:HET-domain-containing protein [Byssothecium circinans]